MTTASLCGQPHPRLTGVCCTKEAGHPGKHGKPALPYRSVLWDMRRSALTLKGTPS